MTEKPQTFSLAAVLSVVTGRLLSDMGDLYGILSHITADEIFTHQIPRALNAAKPWLLKSFPELQPVPACLKNLDSWIERDHTGGSEGVKMWLTEIKMMFPEIKDSYEVPPMLDGWESIDPVLELGSMVDPSKIVTVTVSTDQESN